MTFNSPAFVEPVQRIYNVLGMRLRPDQHDVAAPERRAGRCGVALAPKGATDCPT